MPSGKKAGYRGTGNRKTENSKTRSRKSAAKTKGRPGDKFAWFEQARFGMFIHWGLYAILAGKWKGREIPGIAECIMSGGRIPKAEYEKLAAQFNPARFNADEWVALAKSAGMRYLVVTSKHIDGFAMYHSKVSRYNVVDATPFARDVVRELAEACRRAGLTFGIYHSQVLDLHHPDGIGNTWDFGPDARKDFQRFLDEKVKPQLRELLTGYGPIGLIWFDVPAHINYEQSKSLYDLVHSLQPDCLVNSRIGHDVCDYMSAGDNAIPAAGYPGPWETPATLNETWGFKASDQNWKTPTDLVRKLVDIVSKGGNYLLNVGPTAEGVIPGPSVRALQEVGKWMAAHGASIHGASRSPLPRQFIYRWGRCTAKASTLYLHVFDWPIANALFVPGIRGKVRRVRVLADPKRRALKYTRTGDDIRIELDPARLPVEALSAIDTVLAVEFDGPAKVDRRQLILKDARNVLNAFEAVVHGSGVKYADSVWEASLAITETWAAGADAWAAVPEPTRYEKVACITHWRRADEHVAWDIRTIEAGEYDVELTYAAGDEAAGGECVVTVGDARFEIKVEPTGGWYCFKTVKVGRTAFAKAGRYSLSVKPKTIVGPMLMNLQTAALVPA